MADARLLRDLEIPMRDGVILRADAWIPAAAESGVPAVLFRTPYDRRTYSSDVLRPAHCVDAGFAAVVQDVRGRFGSDGDWAAVQWDVEGPDGHDTIEWIADQPWCSGDVFMSGASYAGIVQWLAAAERPPHLRGIAPTMTTSAELDAADLGGCVRLDHLVTWLAYTAVDWLAREVAGGRTELLPTLTAVAGLIADPRPALDALPLTAIPGLTDPCLPVALDALLRGEIETLPSIDHAALAVPTLSVGGWYDLFAGGTVGGHLAARAADPDAGHALLVGPWAHANWLPNQQGQVNFGIGAAGPVAKVHERVLRFFHACLGREEPDPAVRFFLMGACTWEDADRWPPAGAGPTTLELAVDDGGAGVLQAPGGGRERPAVTHPYDPADPAPTTGGRTLFLGRLATGPLDQRPWVDRADVLAFTSPAGEVALDLVGPVRLHARVATDAADADVVAKLCDVDPAGAVIPVAEGAARLSRRVDGWAARVDLSSPVDVVVDLGHTAHRVQPGHRLALLLTSSNFPHLDRNLGTGELPGGTAAPRTATQTVLTGSTHLELTTRPGV